MFLSDNNVRNSLGVSIGDIASFSVPTQFNNIYTVTSNGNVEAKNTTWAKTQLDVVNTCNSSHLHNLTFFVNKIESGSLDLGSSTQAPLQPSTTTLSVKLWFNLNEIYHDPNVCNDNSIQSMMARLYYSSAELQTTDLKNNWFPHGGIYKGSVTPVAIPNDSPPAGIYDKWSKILYANFQDQGTDIDSIGLTNFARYFKSSNKCY